jgi:hypothetical protein
MIFAIFSLLFFGFSFCGQGANGNGGGNTGGGKGKIQEQTGENTMGSSDLAAFNAQFNSFESFISMLRNALSVFQKSKER